MITLILIFIITAILIKNFNFKPKNFPPGPPWIPFIGSGNAWRKAVANNQGFLHKAFLELAQQYGEKKILGLKVGNEKIVFVGDWDLVKDVLCKDEFLARPDNFFIRLRCFGKKQGITGNDDESWSQQRGFTVRHLRRLGFGTRHLDSKILMEVQHLVNRGHKDLEINLRDALSQSITNILFTLVSGDRFDYENPRLVHMLDLMNKRNKAFNMAGGVLNEMPWLRYILPNWTNYNLIKNLNSEMAIFFEDLITNHEKTIVEGETRDLIDAYLHEMKEQNDGNEESDFNRSQLMMICVDLFIAGSQTTSTSLQFAFLIMILRPDIQTKIQEDLDRVVGRDRFPNFEDRSKLSYLEAFILEMNRYFTLLPIIGPRRTRKPTELGGYDIPEDTTIFMSIYHVSHDKSFWKDPEIFRPERFLNEKGNFVPDDRRVLFGLGHRRCLGESLARACQFVFFATLVQRFRFLKSEQDKDLDDETLPGLLLTPKPYHPIIIPRF